MNADLLRRTTAALRPVAEQAAALEARWIIECASEHEATVAELVARRLAGEPVDRILGRKGFWTLDIAVTPDTLSPRSDTETIVRAALDELRANGRGLDRLRILDLGTGTGAILLALLSELPDAVGLGVDISAAALETATTNAALASLLVRSDWRRGDWGSDLTGPFDLIVSNPPYIPTGDIAMLDREVREHDPHLALDGGADGLDCYRAILPQVSRLLATDGVAVLEIGFGQGDDVSALAADAGLQVLRIAPDLGGVPRAVVLRRL